jgi:hypothetical protein
MKCEVMHPSAMCNKFKQTNSIKTSYKASPFNKYSPYVQFILKPDVNPSFSNFAISLRGYFSKAIYNSLRLKGLYPNCHMSYLFKPRPHICCCLQYHVAAYERVEHDISIGRTTGPFRFRLISNFRCAPIGWTLITHLSYPPGNSFASLFKQTIGFETFFLN